MFTSYARGSQAINHGTMGERITYRRVRQASVSASPNHLLGPWKPQLNIFANACFGHPAPSTWTTNHHCSQLNISLADGSWRQNVFHNTFFPQQNYRTPFDPCPIFHDIPYHKHHLDSVAYNIAIGEQLHFTCVGGEIRFIANDTLEAQEQREPWCWKNNYRAAWRQGWSHHERTGTN